MPGARGKPDAVRTRVRSLVRGLSLPLALIAVSPLEAQTAQDLAQLSQHYCSPVTTGAEGRLASDARPPGLSLALVQVAVRHGDRAPLSQVPGSISDPDRRWSCELDAPTREVVDTFARYAVRRIEDGGTLRRSLAPQPDDLGNCLPGRLTGRGIAQQAALGRHLRDAYGERLDLQSWTTAETVAARTYTRATAYMRTQQSAAALLWGLLPVPDLPVDILVHQSDADEVMFGSAAACPRAQVDAERQAQATAPDEVIDDALRARFGRGPTSLGIDPFVDAVFTSTCHDLPLPCGCGGCVDGDLAAGIGGEADRVMCERYSGADGGAAATALGLWPFMDEIAMRMRQAAVDATPGGLRFALYSGHDTVIGPVLAALGAFDCRWPGYASRIVFELWSTARHASESSRREHYVRVLYDGVPVTGRIPECAGGTHAQDVLCPLEAFEAAVNEPIGPAGSWQAACGLPAAR